MAPKKLTEIDKKAILGLYRQPEETTSTLAERYGVSNSTISRLLKASLPEAEYSALIQQKRGAVDKGQPTPVSVPPVVPAAEALNGEELNGPVAPAEELVTVREPIKAPLLKKREPVAEPTATAPTVTAPLPEALPPSEPPADLPESRPGPIRRIRSRAQTPEPEAEATQLSLTPTAPVDLPAEESLATQPAANPFGGDELDGDLTESWDDDLALSDDYDEDDEDDEDEDEAWDSEAVNLAPQLEALEIYPLTPQALPSLCYLVVERVSSELVALPLRTFASLGQIPEDEGDSRTLPVFDNHRVARRFSRRNQRVIKVPDGALLQTTSPYLQAKGITRLLIDGQVFALEDRTADRAEVTP